MRAWWQRRPLKFRLAGWFATVCCAVLFGLVPFVYVLIEHRLYVSLDDQLKVDWDLVEAHLEASLDGGIQWRADSPATPDSPGYAGTSFDTWDGADLIMDHAPLEGIEVVAPPRGIEDPGGGFYSIVSPAGVHIRVMERLCVVEGREASLRVFRDISGLHRTLRQIVISFALGAPLAALLAALGGYVMAGRMLQPVGAMAEQAEQITSESLSQRLPNPNPHDEIGRLAGVFNDTLERLENSFESLKQFTADASHELRTPLTALRTVGEVALREQGDVDSLREATGSMLEEAQRLNDLIDSLLLLARGDAQRDPLQMERVPLRAFVEQISEWVEVLAAEKGQSIEIKVDRVLALDTDPRLLRHALSNLLHNAVFYSYADSTIQISAWEEHGELSIEVRDEGPGIAADFQKKIFERFFRIDKARSREGGGFGLGLAIVQLSVERLGGRVDLISELGKGSRFRIILPKHRGV